MAIFAVIAPGHSPQLAIAIPAKFPKFFEFGPGQFVVAPTDGQTAQQVAQSLGVNGEVGQFVVFSVAGFFGFHRKDLWEWLTLNSG